MPRLIATAIILILVGIPPGFARGGGMHSHSTPSALSAPANPSVPPSLTPDARLTGSAPLPAPHPPTVADSTNTKPDPEDANVDRIVKSVCRGC
ncbi:MAG: hypothetical protein E7813_01765 [Bradyrhizobium sp.]|uniref:hypothetical protein n=1 Tax=Bradyrhizobium sp. TaxID=376 RepID=UPI0012215F20|nr:hypothetical protein [Bradyrhizobium sp.]THD74606.1 MAG: hypothetical protein E7813_01765 [Bradyrhizobium sp.]